VWNTENDILLLQETFKKKIRIISDADLIFRDLLNENNSIFITYQNNNHFNALVKQSDLVEEKKKNKNNLIY
jgi:hypothetical protein